MTIDIAALVGDAKNNPAQLRELEEVAERYRAVIRQIYQTAKVDTASVKLKLEMTPGGNVSVHVMGKAADGTTHFQFARYFVRAEGPIPYLQNDYFEIGAPMRNLGISNIVNKAGAEVLTSLGGKIVEVHANLSDGGYVWLRKGFFPPSRAVLDKYIRRSQALSEADKRLWLTFSVQDLKAFVLSDDFKAEKWLTTFRESDWSGSLDITDPVRYQKFTGVKPQFQKPTAGLGIGQKTANQELYDALVRHQTYLLRFGSNVRNKILSVLDATEPTMAFLIRERLTGAGGLATAADFARMQKLIDRIKVTRGEAWAQIYRDWTEEMQTLATAEASSFAAILKTTAPVEIAVTIPEGRLLRSIATSRPFEGALLKDWAQTMERADIRRISSAIQSGMVAGEGSAAIARRVVGTKAFGGMDGMTSASRREVQAITRTAVMHVSNEARREFLKENSDLFTEETFVATLDSRTTPQCKAYDGEKFESGKGPQPPLHINCRSLRIMAFEDGYIGDRPAKPVTEKQLLREYAEKNNLERVPKNRAALPRGTKGDFDDFKRKRVRELTGPIPSKTSYQSWLESQTKDFQDDTLGITRSKLFRDGDLPLTKFIDEKGTELTLPQLAQKERQAFIAAGLDPDNY